MRRQIALRVALLVPATLATWLVVAPAAMAGDPCFHGFDMPPVTTEATNQIKLLECAFGPTIATVPTGSTVTFVNGPHFAHLVTGAGQTWGSRDIQVQPNAEISYRFEAPGLYPYACALHVGMSGAIVVGDAASALAAGTTGAAVRLTDGEPAAATTEAASPEATSSSPIGTVALVVAGVVGGIAAGAAAVWLGLRRRSSREAPLASRSSQ
jgi:plastocyanin